MGYHNASNLQTGIFLNSHIGISCLFSKKFLTENMTGKRRAKIQEIQLIS